MVDGLTEKMKAFCREYVANGGNATQAYLAAYDSKSPVSASIESSRLLDREDIKKYLDALNKPLEKKAISEREKKRTILWEGIQRCIDKGDEAGAARYMDILNKIDSEYVNLNVNRNENSVNLDSVDLKALKQLSE